MGLKIFHMEPVLHDARHSSSSILNLSLLQTVKSTLFLLNTFHLSCPVLFQVWEALVTLLFFPVCVILAWIADRRLLFYKYMGKRYRADKRHGIVVETEGDLTPNKGGMEMIVDGKFSPRGGAVVPTENSGGGMDQDGPLTNNIGMAAGAMTMGARGNLPNSNSAMVNVENSRELDESRREVRDNHSSLRFS